MTDESKYSEHKIFDELVEYQDFYKSLSDNILFFTKYGVKTFANIDSYAFSSIAGTLESIRAILQLKRIGDAYTLIRKYRDSIYVTTYIDICLKQNFNFENWIVKEIDDWINGRSPLPRKIHKVITDFESLKDTHTIMDSDGRYKKLSDRSSDYVHHNKYSTFLMNDSEIDLERVPELNRISMDVRDLFVLHFAYIMALNEHYIRSSDFSDYMDFGESSPDGSDVWVAPFAQDIFDAIIKKHRPDFAAQIMKATVMELT